MSTLQKLPVFKESGGSAVVSRHEVVFKVVESELARPYRPCSADCLHMGLKVCDKVKKTKLLKILSGSYSSIKGSKREMVKRGYKSIADPLREHLESKPPAMLTVGDLAIVSKDGVEHVAVCMGPNFIVKGENGREVYLLNDVISGFEV